MMEIKPWHKLSLAEQNLYLTLLWEDGYGEKAIADFFATTKGRVVRRRHTLKLSSGRVATRQAVNPDRFHDLLDLHAMKQLEKRTKRKVVAIGPVGSCQWPLADFSKKKPVLCSKPVVPGHKLCKEHLPLALKTSQ